MCVIVGDSFKNVIETQNTSKWWVCVDHPFNYLSASYAFRCLTRKWDVETESMSEKMRFARGCWIAPIFRDYLEPLILYVCLLTALKSTCTFIVTLCRWYTNWVILAIVVSWRYSIDVFEKRKNFTFGGVIDAQILKKVSDRSRIALWEHIKVSERWASSLLLS